MKIGNLFISLDYASITPSSGYSSLRNKLDKVSPKFDGLMHSFMSKIRERRMAREGMGGESYQGGGRKFDKEVLKKHGKSIVIALGIIAVIILLGKSLFRVGNSSGSGSPEIKPAIATVSVNKEFSFPLTASGGEKVSDVKFMIETAELRDEIIVNGARATSIKGRDFLILTVKISNEYSSAIQIDTKDYVRLSVNGNQAEWLAPDIHNDPVQVQAISTKYTRLGFAINESDKDLVISIGEINGSKEVIPLEFK